MATKKQPKGPEAPPDEVAALKAQLAALAERLAALEGAKAAPAPATAPPPAAAAPAAPPPAPAPEPISEEVVLVLSAAIAAFLGKRPVIRQIRLLSSEGWAHAGRVSIQGSHALR
ncbi:MAG: hypothetical protein U0229_01080 [Anaeromyxobacter sp.]